MSEEITPIQRAFADWREEQRERELARAVRSLLHEHHGKAPGWCSRAVRDVIEMDPELTAYLRAVAVAGEDAWSDEVERVRKRQMGRYQAWRRRTGGKAPAASGLSILTIMDLLPNWRSWGRMLIEANKAL